ncbi:SIMPL domain-containing protein [Mucilaginibacter robiniae]|uniref:SIMPL domain-containing protein n=1 Tax=Mucilaginibacter robiniae TaxID=2728022 RepID=A0A7L5DWG6_9SPHI|nr:SIMPL domain-containing protein [Mucilaginibacter robiniae]QJD95440.1 SIMPL domain-containing protein [Mucilaginibacter robiniae]
MKKLMLLTTLCLFIQTGFAQNMDLRNRIEVTGNATQEITPDIIYVSISLKEYMDGKNKVTIDQLENQLEKAVNSAGVPKADFTINNVSAYNNTYQKKKNPDFLAAKQYRLKLQDLNRLNQILAVVDAKGIQSTNVDSYDYSKMDAIKRDLKIKALLNAREKAGYMLTAVGEKLGHPIDITENDDINLPAPRPVMYMAKMATADAAPAESDIDFKTIKLNFTVRVIFEIVK